MQALKSVDATVGVEVYGDCPLIDPEIIDLIVKSFLIGKFDSFGLKGNFPDGLDCTIYSFNCLKKAWENAELKSEREHVGPYIEKNPQYFNNGGITFTYSTSR